MAVPNIAPKSVGKVGTEFLEFDPENPRLIEEGIENPTDAQIILALADTADLSEVVQSIASNGYFDIEALIGQKVGNNLRRHERSGRVGTAQRDRASRYIHAIRDEQGRAADQRADCR
jgi:hypothetical protein